MRSKCAARELAALLTVILWAATAGWNVRAASFPSVSGFTPNIGRPGDPVTISGQNFLNAREVRFNNTLAAFEIQSAQQIRATVPVDAVTGPISVVTTSGSGTSSAHFFVSPRITDFSPTRGLPGSSVVINGANFIPAATAVEFGGKRSPRVTVTSATQLHADVPSDAVSGPIKVLTGAGEAQSTENFVVAGTEASITNFSPSSGSPGTVVTVNGTYFTGAVSVKFNGVEAASVSVVSSTQLHATVPSGATTGPISVTTGSGTAQSSTVFSVSTAPVIDSFSPERGEAGTEVVLTGRNFSGVTAVHFHDERAAVFTVVSLTQIRATVPAGAGTGLIRVLSAAGNTQSGTAFEVTAAPLITGFEPVSGPVGSIVVIHGESFLGATEVKFYTNAATFEVVGPGQIHATVPAGAHSGSLQVRTPSGVATSSGTFSVTGPAPIIDTFSPPSGLPGTTVTIGGLNFDRTSFIAFGGVSAAFQVTAPTQISATVPAGALTGPIVVRTPFGEGASANRFIVAPRLSGFSPTNGLPGASISITGTNLTDVQFVRFNGAAAEFQEVNANSIVATVPMEAVTGPISVQTPGGIVSTTNSFRVKPIIVGFDPASGPAGAVIEIRGGGFQGATNVTFNGAPAAFSVEAPTRIRATVPSAASTGPVVVRGPEGEAISPEDFVVAHTAALALALKPPRVLVMTGEPIDFTLTVTNRGPAAATNMIFRAVWTSSAQYVAASADQSQPVVTENQVEFRWARFESGGVATLQLRLTSAAPASIPVQFSVASELYDPDLADNESAATIKVVPEPRFNRIERSGVGGNVNLSWPDGVSVVLETTEVLPGGEWTVVAAEPVLLGPNRVVVLPATKSAAFFRLRVEQEE